MSFLFKLAAMLLFGAGFVCGGKCLAMRYVKKTELISDILLVISVIHTRLRYDCLPVPDLLRVLASTDKLKNLRFIRECLEMLQSGEPFPTAWKNAVESDSELCMMLDNCKSNLIQLGEDMGTTDVEGQLACCEYYRQIFEKELADREENSKKYSKLFPSLGVMLGIAAAIMII